MNEETKKIIEDQTSSLLENSTLILQEDKEKLDNISDLLGMIYKTPLSEETEEREKQYSSYRELISLYGKTLGETKYNLTLTRDEYLFLKNLIINKISYDRQNLFVGLIVRDTFFYQYDKSKDTTKTSLFTNGDENFVLNINEITRISHLTSLHEIVGLDKKADIFAEIIKKIGDISKIVEHYNKKGNDLSETGGNWIMKFENVEENVPTQVEAEQVSL
jgi:hypothetical protein